MIFAKWLWCPSFAEWVREPALGGELLFERFEPTDEYAIADLSDHRLFSARSYVEVGPPFRKGAVADRNRRQTKSCDIVAHRHRRDKNDVCEAVIDIGERQKLFAQMPAVFHQEAAHATNGVACPSALDFTLGNRWMPGRQRIEIPNHRPDPLDRCVDNSAAIGFDHGFLDLVGWKCSFGVSTSDLQEILNERIREFGVVDVTRNPLDASLA